MNLKNQKALRRIAIAFALVLVATGLYFTFLDSHTKEAQTRVKLESTQSQLIKAKNDLQQKEATSKEDAVKQLQQIDDLNKKLKETQDQLQAKRQSNTAVAEAVPAPVKKAPVAQVTGTKTDWMRAAGIPESDWTYADFIIMHEGSYNPCIVNGGAVDCSYATNGGQKAYGVCQALPGSKMASAGADWATNPITQLKWCHNYAQYKGGWAASYNFWLSHKWW